MGKWRDRAEALHAGNRTRTAKAHATDGTPSLWWINDQLRPIENGQGDGIRTRTVRVTGGDANCYITNLKNGASGRTRTDEYEFTKLALWLLRHRGSETGAITWICTTNLRLRRAACRTNYTLRAICVERQLVSVIGLAPIKVCLKGRLLELLCIHGRNRSHQRAGNAEWLLAGRH